MTAALVIGEALTDIVTRTDTGTRSEHPGGSPMNVAVGLARLGVSTTLRTELGSDTRGTAIRTHLNGAGVTVDDSSRSSQRTSSAEARIKADGSAAYTFDITWAPTIITLPPGTDLVHTGSLATALAPGAERVVAFLETLPVGVLRSFDPNIRAALLADRGVTLGLLHRAAVAAHIVKLSDEDAAWILPGASPADVLEYFLHAGATLVALTRGADGCDVATRNHTLHLPAAPAALVDTIGAGDAFMSGLLAAVSTWGLSDTIQADALPETDLRAITNAALRSAAWAVSRAGAEPPHAQELALTELR